MNSGFLARARKSLTPTSKSCPLMFQEEKKTLMERVQAVTEVSTTVQNILGMIASYLERVKK